MKKYIVLLEGVKRENDEIGYCDPAIKEEFANYEEAKKRYDEINVQAEYDYLWRADKKKHYFQKSLASQEYELDEDGDLLWDDFLDFLETEEAGKDDKNI